MITRTDFKPKELDNVILSEAEHFRGHGQSSFFGTGQSRAKQMKAMVLLKTESLVDNPSPLQLVDLPTPIPEPTQVLIKVDVCGICHTELDEIEGRTPPPRLPVVPGHQVVGKVVELGSKSNKHRMGDRVGVGWIYKSDGTDLKT